MVGFEIFFVFKIVILQVCYIFEKRSLNILLIILKIIDVLENDYTYFFNNMYLLIYLIFV